MPKMPLWVPGRKADPGRIVAMREEGRCPCCSLPLGACQCPRLICDKCGRCQGVHCTCSGADARTFWGY